MQLYGELIPAILELAIPGAPERDAA
jgi:hypothetical protein